MSSPHAFVPDLRRPMRPIEEGRLRRAMGCHVTQESTYHYIVSHRGEPHHVLLHPHFECDCHDWAVQSGSPILTLCKHLIAALLMHQDPVVWEAALAVADTLPDA